MGAAVQPMTLLGSSCPRRHFHNSHIILLHSAQHSATGAQYSDAPMRDGAQFSKHVFNACLHLWELVSNNMFMARVIIDVFLTNRKLIWIENLRYSHDEYTWRKIRNGGIECIKQCSHSGNIILYRLNRDCSFEKI